MDKIKIGIVGYGNIGRGVEQAIKRNDDMELAAVFTRRDPATVSIQTEGAAVKHFDDMVKLVRVLYENHSFLRVDLYDINNKISKKSLVAQFIKNEEDEEVINELEQELKHRKEILAKKRDN